ncbi:hypothetical protein SH528x_005489 [Novipirellula sp. SH528]|uniref:hypothetical protein n=1 Tax=Novipirellula sp. SH528 TaxID=3454466 RepID=UPI003FA03E9A
MRDGILFSAKKSIVERKILKTPKVETATSGPTEVRVLTWRRDAVSAIWAIKSFYKFAGSNLPLYIHDGGLLPEQLLLFRQHFPSAYIVEKKQADNFVEAKLSRNGHKSSLEYRRKNRATLKLFDFFLMSSAEKIISIDSDIVFFRRPALLLDEDSDTRFNLYNRDIEYGYSMSLEDISDTFDLTVLPFINSGLSSVWVESMNFDDINRWLEWPQLKENLWVTEQTLQAMCSASYGVRLLPEEYVVDTLPSSLDGVVCKHYPTSPRQWFYFEGMSKLIETGFLK